jgi:hypothetical protein
VVYSVNGSLLSALSAQGARTSDDSKAGKAGTSATTRGVAISEAAMRHAAGTAKAASAAQSLEAGQKQLATDLRAAMAKAGVKLTGAVEFSVSSSGNVQVKGSDADKAATQAFLKADTSQPSFASRIANQARDALKLSATLQQSAAASQAAKLAKTSGGVISLYTSLMQQSSAASAVFSLSGTGSSLTYPGSLAANA